MREDAARTLAPGLIFVAVAAAQPAAAQESPTLQLTVSPGLTQQMEEAPAELAWSELAGQLTVEFPTSGSLDLARVPVQLVALAVREGEVTGRAATAPSVVAAGSSVSASSLAGSDWPPAGRWFPAAGWSPDGIGSTDPLPPEAGAMASQIALPSNAGGVVLFAAPAAASLRERFLTVPVVVTTWPEKPVGGADTAAADTADR